MWVLTGEPSPTWGGRRCLPPSPTLPDPASWWSQPQPVENLLEALPGAWLPHFLPVSGGILSPPCSGPSPMPAHPGQRSWSPRRPQPGARGLGGFSCPEPICECFAKCLIQGVPSIKLVQTSGSHIQLHLHSVPFITAGNGKAP